MGTLLAREEGAKLLDINEEAEIRKQLAYFDSLIENSERFISLADHEGWPKLIEELERVRNTGFQDMLKAKTDSDRVVAQGYTQAINFLVNYFKNIKDFEKAELSRIAEEKVKLMENVAGLDSESKEPGGKYTGGEI